MSVVVLHPACKPDRSLFDLPDVSARSPLDKDSTISLSISKATISKFVAAHRVTPVFEAWRHLVGEMPPINNAYHYLEINHPDAMFGDIAGAHACFKGVKRPYGLEDNGDGVYIYVISTSHTIRWMPDMACVADVKPSPSNTVLTVQVCCDDPLHKVSESVWGIITKWEFVSASAEHPGLPDAYADRYEELLWSL